MAYTSILLSTIYNVQSYETSFDCSIYYNYMCVLLWCNPHFSFVPELTISVEPR